MNSKSASKPPQMVRSRQGRVMCASLLVGTINGLRLTSFPIKHLTPAKINAGDSPQPASDTILTVSEDCENVCIAGGADRGRIQNTDSPRRLNSCPRKPTNRKPPTPRKSMKMKTTIALALLALGTSALLASAQDNNDGPPGGGPGGPGGPGGRRHPPIPLIVKALDANGDGVIDSNEIANASAALKTLDKNGDGKLTRDEYLGRPPGPPPQDGNGGGGAGGPPDGGPQGPPPNP